MLELATSIVILQFILQRLVAYLEVQLHLFVTSIIKNWTTTRVSQGKLPISTKIMHHVNS